MTEEQEQPPEAAPESPPPEDTQGVPETAPLSIPTESPPAPAPETLEYLPLQYLGEEPITVDDLSWQPDYIQFLTAEDAAPLLAREDFRQHPTVRPRLGSPTGQPAVRSDG